MDRVINVKVGGNHLSKDSKNAGVRGEANVTKLRITFDEGWEGFNKKITFWNARGLNPVVIDLLPHLAESSFVYLVPIPKEPMEIAGELTFVIEGTVNDKVQRSLEDRLEVKDASIATNAGQPVPPTESELSQLAGEIELIKGDILVARDAKDVTEEFKEQARIYAENSWEHSNNAEEYASRAEKTVGKASYIGDDGYWYAWDVSKSEFYNTGVKAQAGSEVYVGDNPPAEADVWIDPNGEAHNYLTESEVIEVIRGNAQRYINEDTTLPPSVEGMVDYVNSYCMVYNDDIQTLRQEMYDNYVANSELNDKIAETGLVFDGYEDRYLRNGINNIKEFGVYKLSDSFAGDFVSAVLIVNQISSSITQPDGSLKYTNVYQTLIDNNGISRRYWDIDAQKWTSWRYVFKELDEKANKADVFTMEEAEKYIDEQTELIKSDLEGIQKQINEEAHFRGYMSTNAKIQSLVATPNDFAYSAESGTKWIYDAENGWQDSFTPVPDQLTPASTATPLMDGDPTAGESEEYARGDHRHPTDITRVGVSEFNTFKGDLETALDNIIAKYGLGGDVE